ncbi:MAG: response regulator transcription factor [Acidimicrobiia bacterium]|jgi:two-component system, OmpR family, alkaline phosphatase synthesis response regulator PhoP
MDVALFPPVCSEPLGSALAVAGVPCRPVDDLEAVTQTAAAAWSLLIVELGDEPMRRLRQADALATATGLPILAVAEPAHFALVEQADGLADVISSPPDAAELGLRVRRLSRRTAGTEVLRHQDLELNTLTYQATLGADPLDLTFMEYELLRFLVENRGRVWTREQLLSKVWGYDYFGGARTVDVHVRRLRAKLGDERAGWITTVRSVGYRFG